METFFFSISCLFSPRRNQQRQQQPPAKRQRKRYLERLHQQNIHRRSWSQCLTDKSFLAASHRRAFSGGNFTHMKKGRLLRVMGDLGKRRSGCFISHEKAREAPVREMQTVTRKLLFLFYLFTQARPIKQRPGLAAFQPAAGKKPFPLINAGNPDQGNIFFFFSPRDRSSKSNNIYGECRMEAAFSGSKSKHGGGQEAAEPSRSIPNGRGAGSGGEDALVGTNVALLSEDVDD